MAYSAKQQATLKRKAATAKKAKPRRFSIPENNPKFKRLQRKGGVS